MFLLQTNNGKSLHPDIVKSEATTVSDDLEKELGKKLVQDPILQKSISIVKKFLQTHDAILYGGTALNYLLPKSAKFYNEKYHFPDFDVYMLNAQEQTKKLGNILHDAGIPHVRAKAGVHYGTYKLYVDFQQLVDITAIPKVVYDKLKGEALTIDNLLIAPPDWLRMGLYKELMLPLDAPSRWPKIAPRLALLNRYRPFHLPEECKNCDTLMFDKNERTHANPEELHKIMNVVAEYISKQRLILFGATAFNSFVHYSKRYRFFQGDDYPLRVTGLKSVSDFDVFTPDLTRDTNGIKNTLHKDGGIAKNRITVRQVDELMDVVPKKNEISVDGEVIIDLYEDTMCPGYIDGEILKDDDTRYPVRLASLPTMIKMWFTWLYVEPDLAKQHQKRCKIFCAIEFLLNHQSQFVQDPFSIFSSKCGGGKPRSIRDKLREIHHRDQERWKWSPSKSTSYKKK